MPRPLDRLRSVYDFSPCRVREGTQKGLLFSSGSRFASHGLSGVRTRERWTPGPWSAWDAILHGNDGLNSDLFMVRVPNRPPTPTGGPPSTLGVPVRARIERSPFRSVRK